MTAPDRSGIVHALTHTPIVLNTGADITPVGGRRPLSGTEANDVADVLTLGAIRETRVHDNPERDAHWRATRNAIAFGVMATDEVWNGSSWDRNDGTSARLDDLTEQYLAQEEQGSRDPMTADEHRAQGLANLRGSAFHRGER